VHLSISSDWGLKPLYDVIAKIRGADSSDEWVVRGKSPRRVGVRGLGPAVRTGCPAVGGQGDRALLKSGCATEAHVGVRSWDGEEAGLLGSTEWVEAHAVDLQHKAVLYLNSDITLARSSPGRRQPLSGQHLVNEVAGGVKDPETGPHRRRGLRARHAGGRLREGSQR